MELLMRTFLLFTCFSISVAFSIIPFDSICSTERNFTLGSTYDVNRNNLLKNIPSNITKSSGFYNTSVGVFPDVVYGQAWCVDELSDADCQDCMEAATLDLTINCKVEKEASLFNDNCTVTASPDNFFGTVKMNGTLMTVSAGCVLNYTIVIEELLLYNHTMMTLLNNLSTTAANNKSGHFYAKGYIAYNMSTNIYGMVQCARDLNAAQCSFCLNKLSIAQFKMCLGRFVGWFYATSCYLRYDFTPFLNDPGPKIRESTPPPPPQSSQSPSPNPLIPRKI